MITLIVLMVLWLSSGWMGSGFVGLTLDRKGKSWLYDIICFVIMLGGPLTLLVGLITWRSSDG